MANTTTKTIMVDGSRVHAMHLYLASDGAAGELSDYVAVDVSALSPTTDHVRIRRVYGLMSGFSLTLEFDATADQAFITFPDGVFTYLDVTAYGGIEDPEATGTTGDIVATTSGFTAATDVGWLVIEVEKIP
jgi:hypothetical protein